MIAATISMTETVAEHANLRVHSSRADCATKVLTLAFGTESSRVGFRCVEGGVVRMRQPDFVCLS
jgi:hypothetical protein